MSALDHDRVMEVLGDALEQPEDQREEFVRVACNGDEILHAEVKRLLTGAGSAAGAIPTSPVGDLSEVARFHAHPTQIGPYRIIRLLGEGGMGLVYLAEQERPVQRTVALKLIRPGMDSKQVLQRFDSERQALAVMTHPNVARVFDAGVTDAGRPYFVMEFVPGDSLSAFCDLHQLGIPERLALFMRVCDAIQHAHQKGIIHRDLKSSNVLVTLEAGKPLPKVIDFGVARATKREIASSTLYTEQGQLIGTPEYMSPEQAELGSVDIDTRTDVYSLGVILYELLSGWLPFEHTKLRDSGFDELRRIIREVDPPRPSTRLLKKGDEARKIARNRRSEPRPLMRVLRNELDWIAMKAMEKDRDRRYQSAADLAADIGRYLRNEPVVAGPPSTLYRVRKFVRRHRLPVAAAALVLITLLGGMVATTLQWYRAAKAEQATRARFNDVRQLANRLMFDVHNAIATLPGATPARKLIVETATEYLDKLATADRDDLVLQHELVNAYVLVGDLQGMPTQPNLGDYRGALATYRKSEKLARDIVARRPRDPVFERSLAEALTRISGLLHSLHDYPGSEPPGHEAVSIASRLAGDHPDDPDFLRIHARSLNNMASVVDHADVPARTRLHQQSLDIYVKVAQLEQNSPAARRSVAVGYVMLADDFGDGGEYEKAVSAYETARRVYEELAVADPNNALNQRALASTCQQLGSLKGAHTKGREGLDDLRKAVDIFERLVKQDPENSQARMDFSTTIYYLATAEHAADEFDNAVRTMGQRFLPFVQQRYPADSARVLNYRVIFAQMLIDARRFEEAEKNLKEIESLTASAPTSATYHSALKVLASLYEQWNQPDQHQRYRQLAASVAPTTQPEHDSMRGDHGSTPSK